MKRVNYVISSSREFILVRTSNILLKLAVPLRVFKVRRRRVPDFVGVVDGICSDITDLFHVLCGRKEKEVMSTEM